MAANISFNPRLNKYAFVSVKERPWHGLGQIVDKAMTSAECIVIAGLDFEVFKVPNYADLYYPETVKGEKANLNDLSENITITGDQLATRLKANPKTFSTIRLDSREILGTVGSDYTVVDNKEAFEFFDGIVGSQQAIYETAGALGRGETIFLTAKIPMEIDIDGQAIDKVQRYLILSNTHDGSRSLEVMISTIRVVCNNTLAAARKEASLRIRLKHTPNIKDRVEKTRSLLQIEESIMNAFAMKASTFTRIKVTPDQVNDVLLSMYLSDAELKLVNQTGNLKDNVSTRKYNILSDVKGSIMYGPGQNLITSKDTVWGLYNGIASYYQNTVNYKSFDDRMNNILYGAGFNKIVDAYDMCCQLADTMVV